MARFVLEKEILTSLNKREYKNIKVDNSYWFEANTTDEAINKIPNENGTYILKIQTESRYNPFYKVLKRNGEIKILNDTRK